MQSNTNIDCCSVSVLSTMAVSVAVKVVSSFEEMCSLISARVGAVLRMCVAAARKSWSGLQGSHQDTAQTV